jgi:NAD(P)-dependent dehydrogenase (short-subunit alcohol dehydrogenase family)
MRGVFLTGGSRGIGAAAVRALHAQGARIFFTYLREATAAEALCAELGGRVRAVHCDLADHEALPAVVSEAAQFLGRIDTLVNNAATFDENPFFGTTYEEWREGWARTFAVNVFGAAHLTYLVLQHMRESGGGRIINVASRAAHRGELTFADYGASKAALVNLTKSIARSCAGEGIVAIAIAPGFIETEMAAEELERRRDEIEHEIPLRRVGEAEEVAGILAFFASGAGDYANGATIDVNGGSYVR